MGLEIKGIKPDEPIKVEPSVEPVEAEIPEAVPEEVVPQVEAEEEETEKIPQPGEIIDPPGKAEVNKAYDGRERWVATKTVKWNRRVYFAGNLLPKGFCAIDAERHMFTHRFKKVEG